MPAATVLVQCARDAAFEASTHGQDNWEGRAITVRYSWQAIGHDKTHFEQAFSQDGGKTWEVNWIYDGTRVGS